MHGTTDSMYRPPSARIEPLPESPRDYEATGTFKIARSVRDAWASMSRNKVSFLSFLILGTLLGVGYISSVIVLTMLLGDRAIHFYAALSLIYLTFGPIVCWGVIRFGLNALDGRARFADLFSIFEQFGARFGRLAVVGLAVSAASLPGALPGLLLGAQGSTDFALLALTQLWSWTWNGAVSFRLFFGSYFVVDREMGASEALRSAWSSTRGNTLRLIVLLGVSLLMLMAGMLLLIVGSVPAGLLFWQIYSAAFRQIAGGPGSATAARAA